MKPLVLTIFLLTSGIAFGFGGRQTRPSFEEENPKFYEHTTWKTAVSVTSTLVGLAHPTDFARCSVGNAQPAGSAFLKSPGSTPVRRLGKTRSGDSETTTRKGSQIKGSSVIAIRMQGIWVSVCLAFLP